MLGVWFRRFRGACSRRWQQLWAWLIPLPGRVARLAFVLVCWVSALVLLLGVVRQILGPTDAKIVAALMAGLLPAAFLGAYGHEIAARIKKFGPFEVFEVRQGAEYLRTISLKFEASDLRPTPAGAIRIEKFSEKQQFFFDRAERYLNYLDYSGSEPVRGRLQEEHFELLLTFGRSALRGGAWTKAVYWLEHLEKLSHRSFSATQTDNYIAMSYLFSVLEKREGDAAELLAKAAERLSRLGRDGSLDYLGYFWLAYVQDEVGRSYEAVKSNEEALHRRPRYAPAKYNAAVSYAKLGQYREAYKMLARIELRDDLARNVLESAEADKELWDAIDDSYWERKLRYLVRRTRRQLPSTDG